MSSIGENVSLQNQSPGTGTDHPVIWLGEASPLLDAAWSLAVVHHVRDPRALRQALQHHLADCVVIDVDSGAADGLDLVAELRREWPHLGIVRLVNGAPENARTPGEMEHVLSRDSAPTELNAALEDLFALQNQRTNGSAADRSQDETPTPDDEHRALRERMQHIENLLQATFTLTGLVEADEILGDLRSVAQKAVDADDMAVILTDHAYTDLFDLLDLGGPPEYLDVCRQEFLTLDPTERAFFLGDEVLLRERMPDMLLNAPRVREAIAADAWSYMRLPMTIDQKLIGFVALFSQTPNCFDGAHLQLGRLFTAQVATAVRNMRLGVRISEAEQRQRAVSEVARLIAENLASADVLARIVEQAVRLVQGQQGLVLLVQPDNSLLVSAVSDNATNLMGLSTPPGVGQAGIIAQTGQPSIVTNYHNWEGANDDLRDLFPDNATLYGVPLTYLGRVVGVLQVIRATSSPAESREAQDVLMMLASHAAIAIAKAQLHEAVHQEQRQLRAVLDHTPAAVAVIDTNGRIRLFNPAFEHILSRLNISLSAVQDKPLRDVLGERLPDLDLNFAEIGRVLEIYLGEAGEFVVHIAPITAPGGAVEQYVAVAQDVTELRRMDRMKANLTRVLTHDLGGMLMLARSPVELMEEPDIPEDQRDSLRNMLVSSLDRMGMLIEDVRDMEMAGTLGRDTMAPYTMAKIITEVRDRNKRRAKEKSITLEFEQTPDLTLEGHEFLVIQAVDNLIGNAIKYTRNEGRVRVITGREGDFITVRVVDNGIGIPADKLPYIFDPFYRVKTKETIHIPGTGLGLSLVQTIAEGHGGRVTVESVHGEGSTFTLYLPLQPDDSLPDPTSQITQLDLSALLQTESDPPRKGNS
ncbi:MAG: GAF domain-containing protein [Anaerolineae bacterium]|nr:GAF domain-containing protein [Anaerolineae bacterium]